MLLRWHALLSSLACAASAKSIPSSPKVPAYPSPSYPSNTGLNIKEGYLAFSHTLIPQELNAQTWYRIVTPPELDNTRPLVVLHGGPGISHLYLRPTFDLFAYEARRQVIYYDQFGSGKSTRYPSSKGDTAFWTPQIFMAELDNVLANLLRDTQEYDIYGHSWGGMLAAKYTAEKQPKALNKLILASAPAVMRDWSAAAKQLLHDLRYPVDTERAVLEADARGDYANETYVEVMNVYNQNYLCRLAVWPDELVQVLSERDTTVRATMVGGSDFNITGTLRTWDVSQESKQIRTPTLVLRGEFDEAQAIVVKPWLDNIQPVRQVVIQGGSHTSHLEFPHEYVGAVKDFLRR